MIQRRMIALLSIALVLTACSGPRVPLEMTMRQVKVDVSGSQPPPIEVPAQLAAFRQLPLPKISPKAFIPPFVQCPKAGQFAVPELAAEPSIDALPAPGRYIYRQDGESSTGGALPITLPYSPIGLRAVELGSASKGYDFSVAELAPPSSKTMAYNLVRPSTAPGALPGGIYLAAMQLEDAVLGKFTFRPLQPMQFFPLPVQQSLPFASAGVDPLNQVTVSLRGQVSGRKRVDACGSLIDTWEVLISEVISTSESELNVEAAYNIATQYGGLSVEDNVAVTGTRANVLYLSPTSNLHGVISQLPKKPG